MPGDFSRYTSTVNAPPKFARKHHQHQHQHQHQRTSGSILHARVASVDMDRLMDRFLSFEHPQTTHTPAEDLPAPQQAPASCSDWTDPYTSMAMEDDDHQYHPQQHSEPPAYQARQHGHQHHHYAHEHEHAQEHQHQYQHQYQYRYQHQQQHHHHDHENDHQHYLPDTAATHHHQHDQQQHHQHHHAHSHLNPNPYNQTLPASASPHPTPLVSTRRHEQVSIPTYGSEYGTDSHRPHSNTHNGNNDGGQYTRSPWIYVHQSGPQQEQQQQQQHHERHYVASHSPSPSSSSYSSSSSLHHYPSSSSSWASSSSSSHHHPSASSSSSSWASSSSSSSSSPAPATPSSSSYSSLSSSSFSSPAPQPQLQPQPQPQPEPQTQLGPRRRTRTRKAASKSTPSYHAKAAVKCKAAAKANIFRRVVNSPLDPPTPATCTDAAKAAADAASSPSSSSSSPLPFPRRRRRPSPASGSSIPIPERKPPKNAAALAKLFPCPDGTYLHVRHYTDFPIPIPDNNNANDNANAHSEPKLYVPDEHLHLFWRSALGKFDPPDDTRWMPMARDTGVRKSGTAVWTCTAMVMKAGHPRPCGHTRAKSTLIRHINDVHINIRNYRCPWNGCKESFHHRFQLETHVFSMHTFESPYECDMGCGATFKDRAVLSKHRRHVHGNVPCAICPERFWDAVKLAAHWQDAHPGQPVPESVLMGSPMTSAESCADEDDDAEYMDESE